MFIQIENEGEGSATIRNMSINNKKVSNLTQEPAQLDTSKVKITSCAPNPIDLLIRKETISMICDVAIDPSAGDIVTGGYRTLPVIVDVNYTYSQIHSTTLNVKKETIPEGVTDEEQKRELNRQFRFLPYYCPNKEVTDPIDSSFDVKPLTIYSS